MSRSAIWIILVLAGGFVALVIAIVASFWRDIGPSQMSGAGWAAMALGIVVTLALGIGLMSLVFISNRRGYDQ